MTLNGFQRLAVISVSGLALLTTTACGHVSKFQIANNGGNADGPVGNGGNSGSGGNTDGSAGSGGNVDSPAGSDGNAEVAANDSGSARSGRSDSSGGDGNGGGLPTSSPPRPRGLTQATDYLGGTFGNVLVSSGNTAKTASNLVTNAGSRTSLSLGAATGAVGGLVSTVGISASNLGAGAVEGGASAIPIVGPVLGTATSVFDSIIAPAAKITVLDNTVVGLGSGNSTQLIGATAGSASPAQGTLASANVLGGMAANPGAVVSANVVGGQVATATVLPNGLGNGQIAAIDSLANIAVGGTTILPGSSAAVVNTNVLPNGLGGPGSVADLNTVLSPVTSALAPVTSVLASAAGGSSALSTDSLAPVTGLVQGVGSTVGSVLVNPATGGLTGSTSLLGGLTGRTTGSTGGLLSGITGPLGNVTQ
ncbi:MAG TPA: hypothetical protein PLN33_14490 [Hyphomonadaceae bacterium]|nr:hypothetical protein [Hyphomonadaceae bacterium]HPN04366.1 hypothetical protein [Hyphomonadaceae bacterium]